MDKSKQLLLTLIMLQPLLLTAAEHNDGMLGPSSTGHINMVFEVSENVVAGFLQSNLEKPRSEFRHFIGSRLVQRLQHTGTATLPFCVMSHGGAYYEIVSYESGDDFNNFQQENNDSTLPYFVVLGDSEANVAKYKSVSEVCDASSAIQVKIKLNQNFNAEQISNFRGRLNLLVKSE
ncbi:MAG: hypothetical protein CMP91_08525 [Gammaproteobacteria bacterium]|nr:hypothetical protein [Gammaproteobacteria bacterium]MAY03662.1 hypothetical protein [Gammaproteobacteria bacterium]|tara:strand:- start:2255 stop:2785 length:531 start_codon:yes stop_codon:yes gene_type:complete